MKISQEAASSNGVTLIMPAISQQKMLKDLCNLCYHEAVGVQFGILKPMEQVHYKEYRDIVCAEVSKSYSPAQVTGGYRVTQMYDEHDRQLVDFQNAAYGAIKEYSKVTPHSGAALKDIQPDPECKTEEARQTSVRQQKANVVRAFFSPVTSGSGNNAELPIIDSRKFTIK